MGIFKVFIVVLIVYFRHNFIQKKVYNKTYIRNMASFSTHSEIIK